MFRALAASSLVVALAAGCTSTTLGPKSASDIVLLRAVVDSDPGPPSPNLLCDPPFHNFPNGRSFHLVPIDTPAPQTKYVVPAGRNLVVTSFQWQSEDQDGTAPVADRFHTAVFSGMLNGGVVGRAPAPGGVSDSVGSVGAMLAMPTGVVIPGGASVCLQAGASEPFVGETVAFLQGYLVDAQP